MTDRNTAIAPQVLEDRLGHRFNDKSLMTEALTHPSYLHESVDLVDSSYQRLEFLGDAVLGMLLAEQLYQLHHDWDEGRLSRLRSQLAGQHSLAHLARGIGLGPFVRLGRGEMQTDGCNKDSILADVLEALIAAVYCDAGIDAARTLVRRLFVELIASPGVVPLTRDTKSELQELLSARGMPQPEYRLLEEGGPPHARVFRFAVLIDGNVAGEGTGGSKKGAQQAAALQAIERLFSSSPANG